jgi:hypothetical protein
MGYTGSFFCSHSLMCSNKSFAMVERSALGGLNFINNWLSTFLLYRERDTLRDQMGIGFKIIGNVVALYEGLSYHVTWIM